MATRSSGNRLERGEARKLWDADLLYLGAAADAVRRRLNPGTRVTFVVDRNINYTNICLSGCRFCAFYRVPGAKDGYVLDQAALEGKLKELINHGGSGVLLQGGLNPDLPFKYYEDLLETIRRAGLKAHAFSPPEIIFLARKFKLSLKEILSRFIRAGLSSIPGGGAEILVERVRRRISPGKCTAGEWLEVMEAAHNLGLKTSATMMFGHIETREERLSHLFKIRDLQDKTGGFSAFIPWTFQPGGTALGGGGAGAAEYLRTLAVSRLVLDNVPHLQVSWVTQGPKIAQVALKFGADDFGSTMLEENVVAATGVGYRLSREEIESIIKEAGYQPEVRDHQYELEGDSGGGRGSFL